MTALPEDPNPYGSYYFALEIKDSNGTTEVAHFAECSGLKSTTTVFEIEEGGLNGRVHKLPGQSKWENLVMRYATNASTYMLEWRDKFTQDQFENRTKYSGSVALKNNHGDVVRRWHFTNAWPVSWEGPSLNAEGSGLAIETLEIAHDGLTVSNQ
jgi:phage tail-like protein